MNIHFNFIGVQKGVGTPNMKHQSLRLVFLFLTSQQSSHLCHRNSTAEPLPVAEKGEGWTGRNRESCERSKRSETTMFLTEVSQVCISLPQSKSSISTAPSVRELKLQAVMNFWNRKLRHHRFGNYYNLLKIKLICTIRSKHMV